MSRTGFYLFFVPLLTVTAMLTGFAGAAFALTQPAFQPGTRRGLVSLTVVLVIVAALFVSAFNLDHTGLHAAAQPR